jgi:hypothetical protein
MVLYLFYLWFIGANATEFFGLWCISRAGSATVCFAVVCFCFPWLRRIMSVLFDRFTFLITHRWACYRTYSLVVTLVLDDCVQLYFFAYFPRRGTVRFFFFVPCYCPVFSLVVYLFVLICKLQAYVSWLVQPAWSAEIYRYHSSNNIVSLLGSQNRHN